MNVIVVNESRGKAYARARRILGKYLPQLARRAWAGRISQEGLELLQQELRASASKATAVSCLKVATRHRFEPIFVIGSRANFDEQGRIAFRVKRQCAASGARPLSWLLEELGRLAALFHDLGKVSVAFQRKLFKGECGEPLRHEILSALLILQAFVKPEAAAPFLIKDSDWLKALAEDPSHIAARISADQLLTPQWLTRAGRLAAGEEAKFGADVLREFHHAPLFAAVVWLVLTHHRHIGTRSDTSVSFVESYVNEGRPERLGDNVRLAPGRAPWHEREWLEAVQRCAQRILRLLHQYPSVNSALSPESLALLLVHFSHPLLVYADRAASIRKTTPARPLEEADDSTQIYANTRSAGKGLGPSTHTGDTLSQHLRSTARWSRELHRLYRDRAALFPRARFSDTSPVRTSSGIERFTWQDEAAACVRNTMGEQRGPAFISVAAETGSGKTLGAAKLIQALSSDDTVRYTVALGRLSLTHETGKVLRELAGLSSEDCAVIVGNPAQMRAAALEEALDAASGQGSESLVTPSYEGVEGSQARGAWVDCFEGAAEQVFGGAKTLRLLDAPVLACTIDHLVPAVQWTRSSDTAAAFRLYTSDLVLDEIDDYCANDLVAVTKLVFETARNGHSVIVMSATSSSLLIEELERAWLKGFELYRATENEQARGYAFAVSNLVPTCALPLDPAGFASEYRNYLDRFCCRILATDVRRRVAPADPRRPDGQRLTREELYKTLVKYVRVAHTTNHEVDPATGARVSVGAVRFRTAREALRFGEYLFNRELDEGPSTQMKVCVYHAKMPLLVRNVIEAQLRALLTRKDPGALCRQPLVRSLLDSGDTKNLIIVIATTSIIETGRDFDLDWGVYEPNSVRAVVQFAGRLRRHRPAAWSTPNLFLLNLPVHHLINGCANRGKDWGRPGVEDNPAYLINEGVTEEQRRRMSAAGIAAISPTLGSKVQTSMAALPLVTWKTRIDSTCTLKPPATYESNRLGAMELTDVHYRLAGPSDASGRPANPMSARSYFSDLRPQLPVCLTDAHAKVNEFRKSAGESLEVFLNPDVNPDLDRPRFVDSKGIESPMERIRHLTVRYPQRALLDIPALVGKSFRDLAATGDFGAAPHRLLLGVSLQTFQSSVCELTQQGAYHLLLGYYLGAPEPEAEASDG